VPRKSNHKKDDESSLHNQEYPDLEGEDLINFLESKLEQIEKNLGFS
jgi:hypothetical protein